MVISGAPSELARSCRGAGSCRICCDQQERAENTHEGLDPGTAGDLSCRVYLPTLEKFRRTGEHVNCITTTKLSPLQVK